MGTLRFVNFFRALAAFWVLCAHVQIWGGHVFLPVPSPKYGVDLFMLVSGFLMVATTSRNDLSEPSERVRFWIRRFFRIAPTYYLALLVLWLGSDFFLAGKAHLQDLGGWGQGTHYDATAVRLSPDNLAMHLSFLFGMVPHYVSATSLPDWSISLEMQFYFFFPFLALLARRFGVVQLALLAVAVFHAGRWYGAQVDFPEPSLLAFKLHVFVAGMLLYDAMRGTMGKRVGAIALALFLAFLGDHWIVPAMVLAMLACALLEANGDPLAWLTDNRVTRYASDVSYTVYLFQGFCVGIFGLLPFANLPEGPRTALLFVFVVAGAYGVGWFVRRWAELPGIALGRALVRRPAGVTG